LKEERMERCNDDVCETDQQEKGPRVCPRCGTKGKSIEAITVRYLVQGRFQNRINESLSYSFCLSPECPAVYFSEEGDSIFTKEELSERVTIKEKDDPLPICYCFNFFRHDVEAEVKKTGKSSIPEFISAQVKAGHCFCEYTNPQGTCCLGNVNSVLKAVMKKEVKL